LEEDRANRLTRFLKKFNLIVKDLELLNLAFVHPSYAHEQGLPGDNQRLEFLGDAVLDLIVADHLYHRFPQLPEGFLTKMRAALVSKESLAKIAKSINLGELLLLGQGEEVSGGRERPSLLADALEALIGSLYLQGGMEAAKRFALPLLEPEVDALQGEGWLWEKDSKSVLQELVQQEGAENVVYRILAEWGPDHAKRYRAGVFYRDRLLATGEGSSKKEAEQEAARAALRLFKRQKA